MFGFGGVSLLLQAQNTGRRWLGTLLYLVVLLLAALTLSAGLQVRGGVSARWEQLWHSVGAPILRVSTSNLDVVNSLRANTKLGPLAEQSVRLHDTAIDFGDSIKEPLNAKMVMGRAGTVRLTAGRWVRVGADDELVLDASLARNLELGLGRTVTLRRGAKSAVFTVVGLGLDPLECLVPECAPGQVWLDPAVTSVLGELSVRIVDTTFASVSGSVEQVQRELSVQYGNRVRWIRTAAEAKRSYSLTNGFLGTFVAGFGSFVLLATAIVIVSTTTTRMSMLRRDLALFQALGATTAKIALSVYIQNLVIGVLAAVGGITLAQSLSQRLTIGPAELLPPQRSDMLTAFVVVAVVEIVVLLSTAFALRLARTGSLIDALRPNLSGGPTRRARKNRALPITAFAFAGRALRLWWRHLLACLTALLIASTAAVMASGYDSALQVFSRSRGSIGVQRDLSLFTTKDEEIASIDRVLATSPLISAHWRETSISGLVNGTRVSARFVEGPLKVTGLRAVEGTMPEKENEVVAGYGFLRDAHVHVGDTVDLIIKEQTIPIHIVGRVLDVDSGGVMVTLPLSRYPGRVPTLHRSARFTRRVAAPLVRDQLLRSMFADPPRRLEKQIIASKRLLPYRLAIGGLAGLVIAVALIQLATSVVLGIRSNSRDIAILRALGIADRIIVRGSVMWGCCAVMIAAVGAVPIGHFAFRSSIDSVARQLGIGDGVPIAVSAFGQALALLALLAGTIVVAWLATHGQLHRTVSESMRDE